MGRGTGWEKTSNVSGRAGRDKERFQSQRRRHSTNLSLLAAVLSLDLTFLQQVLHGLLAPATSPATPSFHMSGQSKKRDIFCGLFLCNKGEKPLRIS